MWVDDERIGKFEPPQLFAAFVGEDKETAICSIDVVPEVVTLGDLADLRQRIDSADVGRPGLCDHEKRIQAGRFVFNDQFFEFSRNDPKLVVDRNEPENTFPQTGDANAFVHRMVSLF